MPTDSSETLVTPEQMVEVPDAPPTPVLPIVLDYAAPDLARVRWLGRLQAGAALVLVGWIVVEVATVAAYVFGISHIDGSTIMMIRVGAAVTAAIATAGAEMLCTADPAALDRQQRPLGRNLRTCSILLLVCPAVSTWATDLRPLCLFEAALIWVWAVLILRRLAYLARAGADDRLAEHARILSVAAVILPAVGLVAAYAFGRGALLGPAADTFQIFAGIWGSMMLLYMLWSAVTIIGCFICFGRQRRAASGGRPAAIGL